jgi:SAM-dependent methyltransferase
MSVSREEVLWCYLNLLAREPESEEIVSAHMNAADFKQLVHGFTGSPEFKSRQAKANLPDPSVLPAVLDKQQVDVIATAGEFAECTARVKSAWEHLGDEKVHWSVLSIDEYLPDNLNASIDTFWEAGTADATVALHAIRQFGFDRLGEKVCVEYGCGVGRVTVNFAKHFRTTHAYDISRNHIAHAQARANTLGIKSIVFHECLDGLRDSIEPCDFFYSIIVLQHNPPPVIVELVRLALEALNPGGIAMFQVPIYIAGYHFSLGEWLAADHKLEMQMHCVPQHVLLETITLSGCQILSVREDGWSNASAGIVSNTFVCRK